MPERGVHITIDLQALQHNFELAQRVAPNSKTMAVIKADAYGHGAVECGRALSAYADAYAVVFLDEAKELRESGICQPILLLQGCRSVHELEQAAALELWTVVHSKEQLRMHELVKLPQPVTVWLKIDTGMGRLGFSLAELPEVYARLSACQSISSAMTLMTHLACADERHNPLTLEQCQRFRKATASMPCTHSIANSAGVLGWPITHAEWNRVGIMLYGGTPFVDSSAADLGLKPVMGVESSLIAIQNHLPGDTLGYGAEWVCPEAMPVGIVAVGYGDGYPRGITTGNVLIGKQIAQIIGRVSMDSLLIDLRGITAHVGDNVVLWGAGFPIEEVAQSAATINYELMCQIRGRRHYR